MEKNIESIDNKELFGNKLKKIRNDKNISTEDLIDITNLSKEQINNIENGISTTNNNIQRMYILKYLKGLKEENNQEILELLDETFPNDINNMTFTQKLDDELINVNFEKEIKTAKKKAVKKEQIKIVFYVIIVLIVIVSLVIFLFKNINNNINKVTVNETTLVANTTLTPKEIIDTKPKINIFEDNGNYKISGEEEYNVIIKFKGDAYIQIPNKEVDVKTYKKDEEIKFSAKAKETITINTGKYENLEIFVNDEELKLNDAKFGVLSFKLEFE